MHKVNRKKIDSNEIRAIFNRKRSPLSSQMLDAYEPAFTINQNIYFENLQKRDERLADLRSLRKEFENSQQWLDYIQSAKELRLEQLKLKTLLKRGLNDEYTS